jgi:hypothetical protein
LGPANIRLALQIYLGLPAVQLVGTPTRPDERRLAQKLLFHLSLLSAQVRLSLTQNAALKHTIDQQALLIQLLKERVIESPAEKAEVATHSEPLNRYVAVTAVRIKGLTFELPKLLRDLKNLFRRRKSRGA